MQYSMLTIINNTQINAHHMGITLVAEGTQILVSGLNVKYFTTAQALSENTTLTHLNLSQCGISSGGISSLSSCLRNKLHLQNVDLSDNWFGSEGAKYLGMFYKIQVVLTQTL